MSANDVVEQSLANFWHHHDAGHFKEGIEVARKIGFEYDILDFVLDPESYYVPNRRGDEFIRPNTVSSDSIPVIGLEDNRRYEFERPTLHRLQRIALSATGVKVGPIEERLSKADRHFSSSGGSPGTASVHFQSVGLEDGTYIASKPKVLLNLEREGDELQQPCAGVLLHELIHVAQYLSKPQQKVDDALKNELEAYAVQATLLYSYTIPYSAGTAMAATVDEFRQHNLGKNVFQPTEAFTEAFKSHNTLGRLMRKR